VEHHASLLQRLSTHKQVMLIGLTNWKKSFKRSSNACPLLKARPQVQILVKFSHLQVRVGSRCQIGEN
jgi:predicted secreted Zn-dependent protease